MSQQVTLQGRTLRMLRAARPGGLVLRNVGAKAWAMIPVGENPRTVDPERRLGVRPMTIDFGSARGRIVA